MELMAAYHGKLAAGALQPDAAQAHVAARLAELAEALNAVPPEKRGLLGRLFARKPAPQPRGLYIHGEVGRGKTMLMDLFFAHVHGRPKRRVHFHAFMQDVHRERAKQKTIEQIADGLAQEARLLCLDEMQIVDIADAMIIGRLFEALEQRGVVFVTTSNLPPDGLYKDGLNRQLFLPFIAKLNSALDVVSLESQKDYRLGRMKARETFLHPVNELTQDLFGEIWDELTDGAEGKAMDIEVLGRKLRVPAAAHGCASFTFDDLVREPLGPPDYLAIARSFRTVFIEDIQALKTPERNEVKRFILMIDTFYDAGTRLVALSRVPPEKIGPQNKHSFEFKRTLSRLKEMQSASWWGSVIAET